ncbi:GGDEF domain-containing protein [Psychromonas sp. MME2]|uniref:GGDEF domain-containing protein n=1 Tax=unclassified Psychromonas TaxID=2614957 RepID=UPI00339CBC46
MLSNKLQINKKIVIDILLITLLNLFFGFLFSSIDILKLVQDYAINYPSSRLHIIIPLTITLLMSGFFFVLRRWHDSTNLNKLANQRVTNDGLTKLYNRRTMESKIQEEWWRFVRYKQPFCLMLLDIDDFRAINDNFGHRDADRLIVEIADKLVKNVRQTDFCSRWSGTEFLILCPVSEVSAMHLVAERVRTDIYGLLKDGVELSVSIGISEADLDKSLEELIKNVEFAIYKAKKIGGNTVVAY